MSGDLYFCPNCGEELVDREVRDEGLVKYCQHCQQYFFPHFNVAVSMIVRYQDEVLFIKQYGGDSYILVAGYINRGEAAEEAAKREVKEEIGLNVDKVKILKTKYFLKTNTLMINCLVLVTSKNVAINYEVDSYKWFSLTDGLAKIKPGSLAKEFYQNFYDNYR